MRRFLESSAFWRLSVVALLFTGIFTLGYSNHYAVGYDGPMLGHPVSALNGTVVAVSTNPGVFNGTLPMINTASAPACVEIFDTNATVTLGTTPPTYYFWIPANSVGANGAGETHIIPRGLQIKNGIQVAAVTSVNGMTGMSPGVAGTFLYN